MDVGPREPGNYRAVSACECQNRTSPFQCRIRLTDRLDTADNLVAENQRQLWIRQFAVDNMKIGPANGAHADPNEQLSPARLRSWIITQRERRSNFFQDHRAHWRRIYRTPVNGNSGGLRNRSICLL